MMSGQTCQSCEGSGRLATGFYDRDGGAETFVCPECSGIGKTPWGAEHRAVWLENVEVELRKVPGLDEKDIEVLTAMASAGLDYAEALKQRRATKASGELNLSDVPVPQENSWRLT